MEPKSGCTSLAKWFFYQIDLLQTALNYSPFIHNYEYDIYKNAPAYSLRLGIALREKQKETFKLVRNPYKRAVSSFVSLIAPPYIENPEWKPIRKFLYQDENSSKGLSFKQFLYYLLINGAQANSINPHFTKQYIADEEKYVTNYIYLENFNQDMKALEKRFELKNAPINEFSTSWHHQTPSMIYKGNFSESDITDPLFPVFQLSKVFMILNVYNSFKQYFKMISIRINIAKNIHTDFNLLSFQIKNTYI